MKRRLIGALILVAMLVLPGLAVAGSWTTGQVLSYDRASGALMVHVFSGPSGTELVRLEHDAETDHVVADNPWGFPPGPCRKLAFKWNLAVRGDAPAETFGTLLALAAADKCSVAFTASDDVAAGSKHADALAPKL